MLVSEFDFELPEELIAQTPLADRASSRMMHVRRAAAGVAAAIRDTQFRELPKLLRAGDLLVFNDTRVIPARLFGRRSGERAQRLSERNPASRDFLRGEVEVLLTRRLGDWEWQALVRPGRKLGVGERIVFRAHSGEGGMHSSDPELDEASLTCEIIARGEYGERTVRFDAVSDFNERLERLGHMPLPPYIARQDSAADRERYQTVYARNPGASAAPTAGLHFTREVLDEIATRGVETAQITLHVGLGTFQPLREEVVERNHLHRERYEVGEKAAAKITAAQREGRRVVAVGTTAVRTLEYVALQNGGAVAPGAGDADIFIYPGFEFRVVGAMLTNFHLPKSSLLMLVSAFAGRELTLAAYEHAVAERYRFFSYGDCMFVE